MEIVGGKDLDGWKNRSSFSVLKWDGMLVE